MGIAIKLALYSNFLSASPIFSVYIRVNKIMKYYPTNRSSYLPGIKSLMFLSLITSIKIISIDKIIETVFIFMLKGSVIATKHIE